MTTTGLAVFMAFVLVVLSTYLVLSAVRLSRPRYRREGVDGRRRGTPTAS